VDGCGGVMGRITIKRDESGNVSVIGEIPGDDDFFMFCFGKVLSGKYTEISWVPVYCDRPKI
jgi:hypothetical protein